MTRSSQMSPTILIAGASGIVGRAALEHFSTRPGWRAIGLSRRRGDTGAGEHLALDLMDRDACEGRLGSLGGVTHLIYAALYEKPGLIPGWRERDQMATNLTMLRNCVEPLLAGGSSLRHISLLQGTKAYGAHVQPMKVPGREREPRVPHENFYWLQEDWLRDRQQGHGWCFTIWRPPVIIGHALGAPMNVLSALGVYAAVRRAEGRPFSWPGGASGPIDSVDARLLARAFEWAAGDGDAVNARAANETFNITNGDVYLFRNIWPTLAAAFGLEAGDAEPQSLARTLPDKADVWDRVVRTHDLRVPALRAFTGDSLIYADMLLNVGREVAPPSPLLSPIKLRQAGFAPCIDSEDMYVEWIRHLQNHRVLPPP